MNDVFISSNWIVSNEDDRLNKVVTFSSGNKDCNIENIRVDNCICLIQSKNDNLHSKPELEINLSSGMNKIDVFSEGSLIEVFGKHDEYLLTNVPNFIDDWEGMAVYHARIILPSIPHCKLKFRRIKDQTRFWLYSIQLTVDEFNSAEIPKPALFNLENVNHLLNNSSQKISEKAEKFKAIFEMCSKNSSQSNNFNGRSFNIENLIRILDCENNSIFLRVKDIDRRSTTKIQSEVTAEYDKKSPLEEDSFFKCKEHSVSSISESNIVESLKCYVNQKFNEMKLDILKHIDFKLNQLKEENNSNLEKILKSLETSKIA